MKQKDYRKLRSDINQEVIDNYLEKYNIDKADYEKARKKNENIFFWCSLGALGLLFSLCAVARGVQEIKDRQEEHTTSALRVVDTLPFSAFNPNADIDYYDYTNHGTQYVVINNASHQPDYQVEFESNYYMLPYQSSNNRQCYIYDMKGYEGFYLSDDFNLNSYGIDCTFNEDVFNGSMIAHYGYLGSDMYLDLHTPNVSDIYTKWLLNEEMSTNVNRTITRTFVYGSYTLDFNDDYINSYNTFNAFEVKASVVTVEYGYRLSMTINALNTTNNYRTTVATTYYSTKASNNTISATSNRTYTLAVKNASNLDYRDDFAVMPYLKSTKIHSTSSHSFQTEKNKLGFRAWFSEDNKLINRLPHASDIGGIDDDRYAETLWGNFGDLIKVTFTSLLPLASIVILPGVTLGAIVIAPFVIGLVILMLRLVKKD